MCQQYERSARKIVRALPTGEEALCAAGRGGGGTGEARPFANVSASHALAGRRAGAARQNRSRLRRGPGAVGTRRAATKVLPDRAASKRKPAGMDGDPG